MASQFLRRIPLKSVFNCRDLGGYPAADGVTQFGRFLRCGIPQGPAPEDCDTLIEYGVRTVIDLRGQGEATHFPSAFANDNRVKYYNFPLMEVNPADEMNADITLDQTYVGIIENQKKNIAEVLRVIANAPEGIILYHCSLGKDRTGNLSYFLLSIAGVDIIDIKADYEVSNTYLQPMFEAMMKLGIDLFNEKLNPHLVSPPKNMEIIDSHIKENYGGVREYLLKAGMTEEELKKLSDRLTK